MAGGVFRNGVGSIVGTIVFFFFFMVWGGIGIREGGGVGFIVAVSFISLEIFVLVVFEYIIIIVRWWFYKI